MALSYTGKLFRRIAICCGAWTGEQHKVFEGNLQWKFSNDYRSGSELVYFRGESGRWTCELLPTDDKEFDFWMALRWLEENGFIERRPDKSYHRKNRYVCYTYNETAIRLTEKGMSIAPAYMKQKED